MSIGLLVLLGVAGVVLLYCVFEKSTTKSRADEIFDNWMANSTVDPEIRRRAIILAGHDMDRIERLLEAARRNSPSESEQWYWEKILYDMERDRRV
jgi:hypothetical protein